MKTTHIFIIAVLLFTPVVFASAQVGPGNFVSCEGTSCSACDLVVMANYGVQWLMGIIAILFAVLLAVAGWGLVTSGGNSSAKEDAKKKFINAFIGLAIVLGAWLLVDTILLTLTGTGASTWTDVQCGSQTQTTQVTNPNASGSTGSGSTGSTGGGSTQTTGSTGGTGTTGSTGSGTGGTQTTGTTGSTGSGGGTTFGQYVVDPNVTYTVNDPADPSLGLTAGQFHGDQIQITSVQNGMIVANNLATGQQIMLGCALISPPLVGCTSP
ncbi:hypothetical protein KC887_08890 [Candidatus Kaiserbacteria bacterium]|nr:hypothetical protein [Candidatus Kaiserbacteria bacterium]